MLAVVNRAAGGGRCGRLVDAALARLREGGLEIEVAETTGPGHATRIAREAYDAGVRRFIAVGGDGTVHEVVNGVVPGDERVKLGFLPLGTGNSFLRDFSDRGADYAIECLLEGRSRPCDLVRVSHRDGVVHSINVLCFGFPADVASMTNRWFKWAGPVGYILGVLTCLVRLPRRAFPLRLDGARELQDDRCLFLTFNNSKFTGGTMMIAPQADTADGLAEHVRFGPIGRLSLLRNFPKLFDGTYVNLPYASRQPVRRVEFELEGPIDIMIDGEVKTVHPESIEVLPDVLDVVA